MYNGKEFGSTITPSYYQTVRDHEVRSDPRNFMEQFEHNKAHVADNPEPFVNDMRMIMSAMSLM
jgi:hypothetical protein